MSPNAPFVLEVWDDILVRAISPEDWPLFRKLRLAALGEAPHAFKTALADWQGSGDTERRWRKRLTDVPFNVVAYFKGIPAGIVSATNPEPDAGTELISMWVAPLARRNGVATVLIDAVVSWARTQRIERISLGVLEANEGAKTFYERCGFEDRGRADRPGPPERRMTRAL